MIGRCGAGYVVAATVCVAALPLHGLTAQCPDGTPPPCAEAKINPSSIAVLYFDNLGRDSSDAYLADGLTEELIVRLSGMPRLEVKSRFESQRVRGQARPDPHTIGQTLRAAYLVTGSLQQDGARMRLRVALVRTSNRSQVWAEVYDRPTADILVAQDDIARSVARAVAGQLAPAERAALGRRPTADSVAYELYVRALGASNTFQEPGLRSALAMLDAAIARDSGFARAYARRAVIWSQMADGYVTGREGMSRAREEALLALERDSSLAAAHAILAYATMVLDFDMPRGLRFARRAVELDPRDAFSRAALGYGLAHNGQHAEAVVESRRAWQSDSLDWFAASNYLGILLYGDPPDVDSIAAIAPRMVGALGASGVRGWEAPVRLLRGDPAGALERLDWREYGGAPAAGVVGALMQLGRRDAAQAVVDSMVALQDRLYFNPYAIAASYAALGDADRAFEWLERAYDQRTMFLLNLAGDYWFVPLRADPRFAQMLRRTGMQP